jgi:hypothetical protein
MKMNLIYSLLLCCTVISCNFLGGNSIKSNSAIPTPAPGDSNFVRILVTPNRGGVCGYNNAPCVTVNICSSTNESQCDTINNVLLDTGSYGLRIFASLLPNNNSGESLAPILIDDSAIAECVTYGDGTQNWGPIKLANVSLNNNQTTTAIPIQILDSTAFVTGENIVCPNATKTPTPATFGLNGIIGVGPFPNDKTVGNYYKCNNTSCSTLVTIPNSNYVTNPITKFADGYNNGVTLTFGAIPTDGAINADGYAIFGVGSKQNNSPQKNVAILPIESGQFIPINIETKINSVSYNSFLDTGSNYLYFGESTILNLPQCGSPINAFLCPSGLTNFSAIMFANNQESATINFAIENSQNLFNANSNTAFATIGAIIPNIGIDWGLPFFFGRTVYSVFANESVVISGVTYPPSPNGYWIY